MASDDDDRLSALADDLLRRVLYFAPSKEAASTSVLSRRWGSLWRSSGAVNLVVRITNDKPKGGRLYSQRGSRFFSRRDAFVRAAMAALDAADARVTRLTLRMEDRTGGKGATYVFLHRTSGRRRAGADRDVVGEVVSHPAALRVEELRVAVINGREGGSSVASTNKEEPRMSQVRYNLSSLPSTNLRVLDLTGCGGALATDAMPRLETLRLRDCSVNSGDLQALMDAAPGLATVHLEYVFFGGFRDETEGETPGVCLRCRAVTELVLEFCGMEGQDHRSSGDRGSIEIDAPRLRYFRYKGSERQCSMASPAPDMAVLELSFIQGRYHRQGQNYDPDKTRVLFWQFVRNFANARILKLKVNHLEDIAVGKARRTELLCTLSNTIRLELEGAHHPTTTKAAAVAIANLLRCCPAVRDLRLKLSTVPSNSVKGSRYGPPYLERKDRLDYDKSIDRFMHRHRLNPVIPLDDDDEHDEVPDYIPGLSGHLLTCLQSSLRVGLQFRLDDSTCFGTQLVKFFTGNAKILEEIYVDSGNRKLCEHRNLNVERWIAPTVCLKHKNLAESSWEFSEIPRNLPKYRTDPIGHAISFTVLPLER